MAPCKCQRQGTLCLCHGSESLQGFLYYYFLQGGHLHNGSTALSRPIRSAKLSICHYNFQPAVRTLCMRFWNTTGVPPFAVHKGMHDLIPFFTDVQRAATGYGVW